MQTAIKDISFEGEHPRAQIVALLRQKLHSLQAVYLFGSRLEPSYIGNDSDWDIAVLTNWPPVKSLQRWEITQALSTLLSADVDLVDLHAADEVMRFQIIAYGERIYCKDPYYCNSFEMRSYSRYQYLEDERRAIIQDIITRGKIYG